MAARLAGAPVTEVFYDRDFGEARTRSALIDRYGRSKTISLSILHYVVHALTSVRPAGAAASPLLRGTLIESGEPL